MFKVNKHIKYLIVGLFSVWSQGLLGQTVIHSVDFEASGGYTTSVSEFTDGAKDYFIRTNGSNIGSIALSNKQGSYWFGAQDIDGEGASLPVYLYVNNVNITGYSSLQLRVYLAEDDDGTNQDWDSPDYVHFDYDIDNAGSWSNALWIENDGSSTNSAPYLDTDFDGTGDGAEITDAFTQYTVSLTGSGTDLDLRISFNLDSDDEDIAIDNIEIVGVPSVPEITTSTSSLSGFSYSVGNGPSAAQSFTVNATNLTPASGNLTINGAADYEVSSDGSTYSSSITIPYGSGTLSATTIYTRLESGLSAGAYNGQQLTLSGGGATTEYIDLSGDVLIPTITASTDSLHMFFYMQGNGPSRKHEFTVSGSGLTPASGNISITAPTNYEVSTDDVTYSSSVTMPYASSTMATSTVYVRLASGLSEGLYCGETLTVSGGGATDALLVCDGMVSTISPVFINEVSNGTTGSQEYIELVIDGGSCATVDIRGIIIDDNNGLDNSTCEGFSTTSTGAGVAAGHYRFADIPQWAAVPSKSIIVLYVTSDKNPAIPADDPFDTSPHDSVYIVPLTSSVLDRMASYPSSTVSCSYTGGTYENPPTSDGSMIFANGGDAAQVRYSDGTFLHGISYGPSPMTGGPNSLLISTSSGGNTVYFFNDIDVTDGSNWTVGSASTLQTPGEPNNASNEAFIAGIGCAFLLDIPTAYEASCHGAALNLIVPDGAEDHQWVEVMDVRGEIARVKVDYDAWIKGYTLPLLPDWQIWRWASLDDNGRWHYGKWETIECQSTTPNIHQQGNQLVNIEPQESEVQLYNALGQLVTTGYTPLPIAHLPAGWYVALQGRHRQPVYITP